MFKNNGVSGARIEPQDGSADRDLRANGDRIDSSQNTSFSNLHSGQSMNIQGQDAQGMWPQAANCDDRAPDRARLVSCA